VATRRVLPTILGIDPGSRITGWALVEGTPERPKVLAAGVIRTRPRQAFADRLGMIQIELAKVLAEYRPRLAAVEAPFHGVSARSALQLAHARGVILATLSQAGVAVEEYSPATVKKMVTGSGQASKEQVAFMVERLAGTSSGSLDLTDAVAVALCHQAHRPSLEPAVEDG
jgi:crossover junction endodeoxyribonuclease RuvC